MPTLSMPANSGFIAHRFGLARNTRTFPSPMNLSTQTLEFAGTVWVAQYSLPPMKRATSAAWQAFFMQLRGTSGRFYGYDPTGKTPRGIGTGTPVANGAVSIGATTMATSGWTANVTGILLTGDYFQVGTELYQLVSDANSAGSGLSTLTFEPSLRTAVSNGAALTINSASCKMRLTADDQGIFDVNHLALYGTTFAAVEAFT